MAAKKKTARKKSTAPARPRRARTTAMAPARPRRKKSASSGKVDLVNILIYPAAGYVIGSLAAKFVGNAIGIDAAKPAIPAAGAYIAAMYLKQPYLAAGMAAAAAAEGLKLVNIPLLSDGIGYSQGGQFPLAAAYTDMPILADGTMVQDAAGNYLMLSDGNFYNTENAETGAYTGNTMYL
jgi:hypothetical protein